MTDWTGNVRNYEDAAGVIEAQPIPKFQFQERDLSNLLIDGQTENPDGLLTKEQSVLLLATMYTIREFETAFANLLKSPKDREPRFRQFDFKYRGAAHLYKGEEAVAAPISLALGEGDYISSTHRGHGHALGMRLPLDQMVAEMLGKYDACCKGKGGSMHITGTGDTGIISLGANGVVGGGYSTAVGAARGLQLDGNGKIVFCFAGDGSTATGASHESMVMAKRFDVPIAFMWEDNGAGMTGRVDEVFGLEKSYDIVRRAWAYDMPGEVVDGMDVLAVLDAFKRAEAHLRAGNGPTLFVFPTHRYWGHSMSDNKTAYTTAKENAQWEDQDAIRRLEKQIEKAGILNDVGIHGLKRSVEQRMTDMITQCSKRDAPPLDTLTKDVFAGTFHKSYSSIEVLERPDPEKHKRVFEADGYRLAIFEALKQLMELDPRISMVGEDVRNYGGAFSVTCQNRKTGPFLADLFNETQLANTPIAEEAIVGLALGLGLVGRHNIAEIMYGDFLRQAANALNLQGKKHLYMFGGQGSVKATVRFATGGGKGYACQHGEEVISEFTASPGAYVVLPSNPFDAKGLLVTAALSDDLVLFGEHQISYNLPKFMWGNEVPEGLYSIPFGKANVVKEGKDVTIWTYSLMVDYALRAARDLEKEGISCEVIDPRTLSPLDMETVYNSVAKTGKLLCVSQGTYTGNIAHSIVSNAAQELGPKAYGVLTAPDCPTPTAENLEKAYLPNKDTIMGAARALVEKSKSQTAAYVPATPQASPQASPDGVEDLRATVNALSQIVVHHIGTNWQIQPDKLRKEAETHGIGPYRIG